MLQIAFYRAAHGGLLDKLIDGASGRGGFSHCELRFSTGVFFSSSGMDGGVRFKHIVPVASHWDLIDLPAIDWFMERRMMDWCMTQVGRKYDWRGVLHFVSPCKQDQRRWFCSEICTAALQRVGLLGHVPPWQVSPNSLRLIVLADKSLTATPAFSTLNL